MKKFLSLLLIICLLLTICGCTKNPTPTDEPTPAPTEGPTTVPTATPSDATTEPSIPAETEPAPTEAINYDFPLTAVTSIRNQEITADSEGQTIFEYTYQSIYVMVEDEDVADAVYQDISHRIDDTKYAAESIKNEAINVDPQYPYSLTVQYEPIRIDSTVLSLFGSYSIYNGGIVSHSAHGLTYDLTTGALLTLDDVLTDSVIADTLCPLVANALAQLPEETYLFDDYISTVENRFSGNFWNDEAWYLSAEGLCFTFEPYEVAPNSSGYIHATIPYDELNGILEDAWFPPERMTPDGALTVSDFTVDSAAPYQHIADVCVNEDGEMILLHTDGLIYDLIIECGYSNASGTRFTTENILFRADCLIPTDAVLLQAHLDDPQHQLRITYTGTDGTVTLYLS